MWFHLALLLTGFIPLFVSKDNNLSCGVPGHGAHTRTELKQKHLFLPNDVVNYTCDFGFVLVGPSTRVCQYDGEWSLPKPFCGAKVSTNRRIVIVSNNIDVTERKSNQGRAILDDGNTVCSVADQADKRTSSWKVDLLELQYIDVIILIFKDKIDVDVTLKVSHTDSYLNDTVLTQNDYSLSKFFSPITNGSSRLEATVYEFLLREELNVQFITVEVQPTLTITTLHFCELLLVSKSAPSFGQCFSGRSDKFHHTISTVSILNNICYTFAHSEKLSWEDADEKCQKWTEGNLVVDVDTTVQRMMWSSLAGAYDGKKVNKNYWIGGITELRELSWTWRNNQSIDDGETFWEMRQPDLNPNDPACLALSGTMGWEWDDQICQNQLNFICQHKILSCGTPEVSENTLIKDSDIKTSIGEEVTYTCPSGYALQGSNIRECLKDGTWSGSTPFCFPMKGYTSAPESATETSSVLSTTNSSFAICVIVMIIIATVLI